MIAPWTNAIMIPVKLVLPAFHAPLQPIIEFLQGVGWRIRHRSVVDPLSSFMDHQPPVDLIRYHHAYGRNLPKVPISMCHRHCTGFIRVLTVQCSYR